MKHVSREQVIAALRQGGGRSLHLMEIVQALGAPKSAKDDVRDVLAQLKELGFAKELPGNRYRLGQGTRQPAPAPPEARGRERGGGAPLARAAIARPPARAAAAGDGIAGWLTLTPRGFGFVAADDGGPDVFVSGRSLGTAMHGDRVEVSVRKTAQGREGEVLRVLERGLTRVAGRLVRARRALILETNDARLPPAFRIVGALPLGSAPGHDVVAQITQWPDAIGEIPEARVLSVLGPRGSAEVEIAKILIREGVNEGFAGDVVQEALGFPATVPARDIEAREDLRELDLVTIDPEDARDHDDAVWAAQNPDGTFRVVVAIADVSHYVREGSAIDREAVARGCSIYLPGRAIPMLPPELSTNLASLVPDEDRLTLAVEVHLGKLGKILSYRFVEGVMRSRARLTYGGVARALGLVDEGPVQEEAEARRPLLRTLHTISRRLRAIRTRRGALGFELPEAKVVLDERGEPIDVVRSRSSAGIKEAYELIEDLMLLANEVVAQDLTQRKLPAIYRVHGKPDANKIAQFGAIAEAFGLPPLEEDAGESPKKLQKLLDSIAGTPHAGSLGFLLLRAMQQASYDVSNVGHFALAARDYLHFTSPIRRYPDLAVHRVVRRLARGEKIEAEGLREVMKRQAVQASRMERRAMTVERDAVSIYRCLLMKDRVGDSFEGTISSVAEHGISVSLDAPFVELRVPVERLGEDFYELDPLGIRLIGRRTKHRYELGHRIEVRLEAVSVERREMTASPTGVPEARFARPGGRSEQGKRSDRQGRPIEPPPRDPGGRRARSPQERGRSGAQDFGGKRGGAQRPAGEREGSRPSQRKTSSARGEGNRSSSSRDSKGRRWK